MAKIAYNSIGHVQCVRLNFMTFQPHEGHKMVPYPLPCGLTHQTLSMVFEIRNSREPAIEVKLPTPVEQATPSSEIPLTLTPDFLL